MTHDEALADLRCRMLLDALARGPLSWDQFAEVGLDRGSVFAAIDMATLAGLACFRVAPAIVERLDLPEDSEGQR